MPTPRNSEGRNKSRMQCFVAELCDASTCEFTCDATGSISQIAQRQKLASSESVNTKELGVTRYQLLVGAVASLVDVESVGNLCKFRDGQAITAFCPQERVTDPRPVVSEFSSCQKLCRSVWTFIMENESQLTRRLNREM